MLFSCTNSYCERQIWEGLWFLPDPMDHCSATHRAPPHRDEGYIPDKERFTNSFCWHLAVNKSPTSRGFTPKRRDRSERFGENNRCPKCISIIPGRYRRGAASARFASSAFASSACARIAFIYSLANLQSELLPFQSNNGEYLL